MDRFGNRIELAGSTRLHRHERIGLVHREAPEAVHGLGREQQARYGGKHSAYTVSVWKVSGTAQIGEVERRVATSYFRKF
jgi:hypothetical protein